MLSLLLSSLLSNATEKCEPKSKRPNIIFILADDLVRYCTKLYGKMLHSNDPFNTVNYTVGQYSSLQTPRYQTNPHLRATKPAPAVLYIMLTVIKFFELLIRDMFLVKILLIQPLKSQTQLQISIKK